MRIATIDIGTNTVLLLVCERLSTGELKPVEERASITRLGEGVDRTRVLSLEGVRRTCQTLEEYAAVVASAKVDRIAVVGTSAMRDAQGGEAVSGFVRSAFGVEARVISGEEEARLTLIGALSGLPEGASSSDRTVFDVGGGSTEIVVGRLERGVAAIHRAASIDIGSVRLSERHPGSDPPSAGDVAAIQTAVSKALAASGTWREDPQPVGIAGTVTTLAAVSLGLKVYHPARVHGLRMPKPTVQAVVDRLARTPLKDRMAIPGVAPKRADVIVAGGLIVLGVLDVLGAKELVVSDRGVRWGLAVALSELPATV